MISGFKLIAGGLEHEVFYKKGPGRVFKITKPPYFGAYWELGKYVRNLIWSNEVFEDDIRLEGVTDGPDGVSIVISQPYIQGGRPSLAQIAEWFALSGYKPVSHLVWQNSLGQRIADAHEGNFILRSSGALIPIDLRIEKYDENTPL